MSLTLYKQFKTIISNTSKKIKYKQLPDLYKSQYWSHEKLIDFQNKRLKIILRYAYDNIPAYRKKYQDIKLHPNDIKSIDDLIIIPITTREEMQDNPLFINRKKIAATHYTGGSTGTSLKYYNSFLSDGIRNKAHLRGWSWFGYKPGKRLAIIMSSQGIIGGKNILSLSGDLSEKNLQLNTQKLLEYKPEFLRGYVSSLYILARYFLENSIKLGSVIAINPISENLYDYQRKTIESAFGGKVFEEYCCNDGGACAWECDQHSSLHYVMERAIIENVDGEMIVTDLWNKAIPFIRYRNGDAVEFLNEKCNCGRNLPLIKVKGRNNDIIITPSGVVGPTYLMVKGINYNSEKYFRSGIRAVQYVQKPNYFLVINIVKNSWCTNEEITAFQDDVAKILNGMTLYLNFVDDIPATAKGKRAFIINEDQALLEKFNKGNQPKINK